MKTEVIKQALDYKKGHLNLALWALNKKCTISVFVDGDIELKKSTNYETIKEHLECADEVEILIYNEYDIKKGWALIIPFNNDDETVADYSVNSFMNEWDCQFINFTENLQKTA